ncbi:hypothetical protein GCM10011450_24090 [Advenella faeciporci]|uniref:Uncharacterized protein n=1 Tax=Advenella faeciporci TaxID=797535 RepID=A0A918JPX4_9BURK|nr:hypothetical protein [Advenella faeciporci]GGW93278.1 hypothetical protein GCM10011450_24090 [Advenella faeciporci]
MSLSKREIVAWQMARYPDSIGHQHACYRKMLEERGIEQSMSRKGNNLDKAAIVSFFGILQSELFHLKRIFNIENGAPVSD